MPIEEIFILPPMGDDGLSVGSGLATLLARDGLATWLSKRRRLGNVYLGQNFDDRIDACLAQAPGVRRHAGEPIETATDLVRQGKAGAVYTGRMEFGPRALGARKRPVQSPNKNPAICGGVQSGRREPDTAPRLSS